uniref:Uncharacterized protein n=1 Tax=Rhizophora mucronata TaxID=61149 RepID=A0A2P2QV61_RHIMU
MRITPQDRIHHLVSHQPDPFGRKAQWLYIHHHALQIPLSLYSK